MLDTLGNALNGKNGSTFIICSTICLLGAVIAWCSLSKNGCTNEIQVGNYIKIITSPNSSNQ